MTGSITRGKVIRADLALWDGRTFTSSRSDATGGTTSGLVVGDEIDVLQVYGAGTNRTRGTIAEAIQMIGSAVGTLSFAPGTWTIDADLTIPAHLVSRIPAGCVFDVSNAVTLSFAGPVLQESIDCVTGTGTVVGINGSGRRGGYVKRSAAEAGITIYDWSRDELDVRRYGAVADGSTDDEPAISAAIAVAIAGGGGEVQLAPGTSRLDSDLVMDSNVHLRGHQRGSHLEFDGAALFVDAASHLPATGSDRHLRYWGLTNVTVSRIGTAGYAVRIVGDGGTGASDNQDAIRFHVDRLQILSSTGGGLEIKGAYIGAFYNTLIQSCSGIGLSIDEQSGTNNTALNAVGFFGGEIQDCTKAAEIDRLIGVGFYGFTFEGCDEGVDILRNSQNVEFVNPYFENNDLYDLRIGNETTDSYAIVVRNGRFIDGGAGKDYAIQLIRGKSILIESSTFNNYVVAGIYRNPASAGAVTGRYRNCAVTGTTPAIGAGENTYFHRDPLETVLTASDTWDPASIADGDMEAKDFTVTGATVGDMVMISPSGALSDLQLTAYVRTADTVRAILSNSTGSPVDAASLTYRIVVWPRTPTWF
jgi:hypothetical protein